MTTVVGQLPGNLDMAAYVGCDFAATLRVTHRGLPMDWAGSTITATVNEASGSAVTSFTVDNSTDGELVLRLAETAFTRPERYFYTVTVTSRSFTGPLVAGVFDVRRVEQNKEPATTSATVAITYDPDVSISVVAGDTHDWPTAFATLPSAYLAVAGDSITIRNEVTLGLGNHADNWPSYLTQLSNGRLLLEWNDAVAGQTSTAAAATFDAIFRDRVLATGIRRKPRFVGIMIGTNDSLVSGAATTTVTNVTAMINEARANGAKVFVCTIPPRGMTALPTPTGVTATAVTSGGTLADGTYSYRVAYIALDASLAVTTTLASTAVTATVSGGAGAGSVEVRVPYMPGSTGYRVYGRTGGSEALMTTVTWATGEYNTALLYTDTGSASPSGAVPGSNTTAVTPDPTEVAKTTTVNTALAALVASYGSSDVRLVDTYSACVSQTTGRWRPGYTFDNLHPTPTGSRVIAETIWSTLADWFDVGQTNGMAWESMPLATGSTANLHANNRFTSVTSTRPTNWARNSILSSTATAFTTATVPRTGMGPGNALTIGITTIGTRVTIEATSATSARITSGFSAGDEILFGYKLQTDGLEEFGGRVDVALKETDSFNYHVCRRSAVDLSGWVWGRFIVRAGATQLWFRVALGPGGGSVSLAHLTVVNLTTGQALA